MRLPEWLGGRRDSGVAWSSPLRGATTKNSADIPENERYWRRLGSRKRHYDLSEMDHRRAQEDAIRNWRASPILRRYLDIKASHLIGSQDSEPLIQHAKTEAIRERAQRALSRFWYRNRLDRKLTEWCIHVYATGEAFATLHVGGMNAADGLGSRLTTTGWLDPLVVSSVVFDPEDAHTRIAAIAERPNLPPLVFPIVRPDFTVHPLFAATPIGGRVSIPAQEEDKKRDGVLRQPILYLAANVTPGQTRGLPDAYPVLDLLGLHMDYLWGASERHLNSNSVSMHLTAEGADAAQLKELEQDFRARVEAGAGQMLTTNERVKLAAVAPALQSVEYATWEGTLRLLIALGLGVPPHWLAEAGDANTSTAGEMAGPTLVSLASAQSQFMGFIEDVCWFALRQIPEIGALLEEDPDAFDIHVPRPDLVSKDAVRAASVLQTTVASISQARSEGAIGDDEAQRLMRETLARSGFELNPGDAPDPSEFRRGIAGLPFPDAEGPQMGNGTGAQDAEVKDPAAPVKGDPPKKEMKASAKRRRSRG